MNKIHLTWVEYFNIEQKNRHAEYFKCPYCRTMYYATLPYFEIDDVKKIIQVNYNNKLLLPLFPCGWKDCTFFGNVYKNGNYCKKHYPLSMKKRCVSICLNGQPCKNNSIEDTCHCKRHTNIENPTTAGTINAKSENATIETDINT